MFVQWYSTDHLLPVAGLANAGRGELQVSGVDRPAGPFAPHPLGQDLELRVGLGTPASVIDE